MMNNLCAALLNDTLRLLYSTIKLLKSWNFLSLTKACDICVINWLQIAIKHQKEKPYLVVLTDKMQISRSIEHDVQEKDQIQGRVPCIFMKLYSALAVFSVFIQH